MRKIRWGRRMLLALSAAVMLVNPAAFAQSPTPGGIKGRVLDAEGRRLAAVTVHAEVNPAESMNAAALAGGSTGASWTASTDGSGRFELADLPENVYALRFESEGSSWNGNASVPVTRGQTQAILVTLAPAAADDDDQDLDDIDHSEEETSAAVQVGKSPKGIGGPLIATLATVGGGILVGSQLDKENTSSPSSP